MKVIDLTNFLEARFKAKDVELKVCNLAIQSIPFGDNYFDIVIFTEVFEHLLPPTETILREVSRVLHPEGRLIFSTPNFARLQNRIKLLVGISPIEPVDQQFKKGWVHGNGHVREYTMKEILQILSGNNFMIYKNMFIAPPPSVRSIKSAYSLAELIYRIVGLLIPAFKPTIYIEGQKS